MRTVLTLALVLCLALAAQAQPDAKKADALRAEIAALKAKLADLEKQLAALDAGKSFAGYVIYPDALKIGYRGVLSYPGGTGKLADTPMKVRVLRVIDKHNLIIDYRWIEQKYHYLTLTKTTDGLVDDQTFLLSFPVHVSGTIREGGRTMLHLKQIK